VAKHVLKLVTVTCICVPDAPSTFIGISEKTRQVMSQFYLLIVSEPIPSTGCATQPQDMRFKIFYTGKLKVM
jgi:hypothetical protein